jgi:hypothetical protein
LGAISLVCYVGSLKGNECFLLDLYGLRLYLNEGREPNSKPHVVAPLLGRFSKNELGEHYHLIFLVAVTGSGLHPSKWLEWLVEVKQEESLTQGPAFCDDERGAHGLFASPVHRSVDGFKKSNRI